jgi:hypothetical protein
LAAAVSAARSGARTVLVERYGFLGGMGTAGGVTNFAGLYGRRRGVIQQLVHGVVDELLERIDNLGGLNAPQDGLQGRIRVRSYDVAAYKCAADEWLLGSGVQLLFHALAVGVVQDAGRIAAVIVETKSGRRAIRGREFVDCSGDADIAHLASVPYELGDGRGDALYPSTMFRIGNVDAVRAHSAIGEFKAIDALMEQPRRVTTFRAAVPSCARSEPPRVAGQRDAAAQCPRRAVDATDAVQLSAAEIEGGARSSNTCASCAPRCPGFEQPRSPRLLPRWAFANTADQRRIPAEAQTCWAVPLRRCDRPQRLAGRSARRAGASNGRFAHDADNAYNHLPWRMLCRSGARQPAGGWPVRQHGTPGPKCGSREWWLLRDGTGSGHWRGAAGQQRFQCDQAAAAAARGRR